MQPQLEARVDELGEILISKKLVEGGFTTEIESQGYENWTEVSVPCLKPVYAHSKKERKTALRELKQLRRQPLDDKAREKLEGIFSQYYEERNDERNEAIKVNVIGGAIITATGLVLAGIAVGIGSCAYHFAKNIYEAVQNVK